MAELEKVSVGLHTAEVHIHARKAVATDSTYMTESFEVVLSRRGLAERNFLAVGMAKIRSVGGDTVAVARKDIRGEGRKSTNSDVCGVNTRCFGGHGSRHLWVARRRNLRDCLGL